MANRMGAEYLTGSRGVHCIMIGPFSTIFTYLLKAKNSPSAYFIVHSIVQVGIHKVVVK